jgi:nicotinamidase-related amidase
MNIVLLVIDMQKAYYKGSDKKSMTHAVKYINCAIELFRKNNKKIIWIQHEDENDGAKEGTVGFEIIEDLKPMNGEKIITKKYNNAYNKTGLYKYLIEEEIDTVIITGYCAEYCILSTYRGTQDNDLKPMILENAIASGNKRHKKFVENMCDRISMKKLEEKIDNGVRPSIA